MIVQRCLEVSNISSELVFLWHLIWTSLKQPVKHEDVHIKKWGSGMSLN